VSGARGRPAGRITWAWVAVSRPRVSRVDGGVSVWTAARSRVLPGLGRVLVQDRLSDEVGGVLLASCPDGEPGLRHVSRQRGSRLAAAGARVAHGGPLMSTSCSSNRASPPTCGPSRSPVDSWCLRSPPRRRQGSPLNCLSRLSLRSRHAIGPREACMLPRPCTHCIRSRRSDSRGHLGKRPLGMRPTSRWKRVGTPFSGSAAIRSKLSPMLLFLAALP